MIEQYICVNGGICDIYYLDGVWNADFRNGIVFIDLDRDNLIKRINQ